MPAHSGKQYRLMAAAAHDPEIAEKTGIPRDVASEFVHKTSAKKRSKWAKKSGWGRKGHQ